jgi:ornithine carbamoyltransferase
LSYQVNAGVLATTGNSEVKFVRCLPALHNRQTAISQELYDNHGPDALEVTGEAFESAQSVVFGRAANRTCTMKALMIATIGQAQ